MKLVRTLFSILGLGSALLGGCGDSDAPPDPPEEVQAWVDIGLPVGDGLQFESLEPGGELRLQTFGQGGTHVLIGVRCQGFGNRAFVSVAIKNLQNDVSVRTPAPVRPQLLLCREEGVCDLVPLLAMTSGLTKPGEDRDGLRVELSAIVKNEAGVEASTTREAVLSTADL